MDLGGRWWWHVGDTYIRDSSNRGRPRSDDRRRPLSSTGYSVALDSGSDGWRPDGRRRHRDHRRGYIHVMLYFTRPHCLEIRSVSASTHYRGITQAKTNESTTPLQKHDCYLLSQPPTTQCCSGSVFVFCALLNWFIISAGAPAGRHLSF